MVDLIIPVQRWTHQLDKSLKTHEQFSNDIETRVHVIERPDLNVSEARQLVLDDDKYGDLVCYLDDDSEMIHDHWLDEMIKTMEANEDAACVFGGEWWGTQEPPDIVIDYHRQVEATGGKTPAACMLVDKRKLKEGCHWDQNIGLRSGWLGGDFEEVDFAMRLKYAGLNLYQSTGTVFHHTGGKTTLFDFVKTDRAICTNVMLTLLKYRHSKFALDEDFFNGIKYVKADPNDDCMLAAGYSLRECYKDVIAHANLKHHPYFVKGGLV